MAHDDNKTQTALRALSQSASEREEVLSRLNQRGMRVWFAQDGTANINPVMGLVGCLMDRERIIDIHADGKATITGDGQRPKPLKYRHFPVRVHQLAAILQIGFNELNQDVSHLCGHVECYEPSHLRYESHETNKSRDICHMFQYRNMPCHHMPVCML